MGMDLDTFQSKLQNLVNQWPFYGSWDSELNVIRVALGADTTTRDATLQLPPVGLRPGNAANTPFTNAALKLINQGKAGNLSTISMANILGAVAPPGAPVNIVPPALTYVSGGGGPGNVGSQYAAGPGTWNPNTGNTRTNQWYSGGAAIPGSTGPSYTAQASDSGNSIGCAVTMTNNGQASAPAMSNLVVIA